MADQYGEKLEHDLATKEVYYFHDPEKKLKQISKEVFKNRDQIIHYPRGFEGGHKYATIRKFIYRGFGGKIAPLGSGVSLCI